MSRRDSAEIIRYRQRRERRDKMFVGLCVVATSASVLVLVVLIGAILYQGLKHLDGSFLTSAPSRIPEKAGIKPALFGSIAICATCAFFALPIGVGTAILLEEYRSRRRWVRRLQDFIQLNITNLAGVPSIVYGIIGLTAFVQMFGAFGNALEPALELGQTGDFWHVRVPFGRGVLAGGLTLMLVILPIVIVSTQEALRAVPVSLRENGYALGATDWQVISKVSLPSALPGIMTGAILAMSRAIGEAAPVLVVAGVVYIAFTPQDLMDEFTAMPLQIYDWARQPKEEFHRVAASGILVLLTVLFCFNALAVIIRNRFQKPLS